MGVDYNKEHYNVKCTYENDTTYDVIEKTLLDIKKQCEDNNQFLIVNVKVGKGTHTLIDDVCKNNGIRRENIKKGLTYNKEIIF